MTPCERKRERQGKKWGFFGILHALRKLCCFCSASEFLITWLPHYGFTASKQRAISAIQFNLCSDFEKITLSKKHIKQVRRMQKSTEYTHQGCHGFRVWPEGEVKLVPAQAKAVLKDIGIDGRLYLLSAIPESFCSLRHGSLEFPAVLLLFSPWQVSTAMLHQCSCTAPVSLLWSSLLLSYNTEHAWLLGKGFIFNLTGVLTKILHIESP